MAPPAPPSPLKRALAWVLVVAGFSAWLFSAEIFPGNSKLYDAVAADDATAVRRLIAEGADPNSSAAPLTLTRSTTALQRYQVPPLIYALRHLKGNAALALIEAGANPDARDRDGKNALALAEGAPLPDVARALRSRGAVEPPRRFPN